MLGFKECFTTVIQLATTRRICLLLFLHKKYGLQQTGEWSPRFWLQATFLSKSYFHTWAIILQQVYHQKQLITVVKKNISDIPTAPYIRDHKKNGLQAHLKGQILNGLFCPFDNNYFTLTTVIFEVQTSEELLHL
ncbi:hypothetical protein QL285_075673 [Trifolium repens]|nr:hypothetical protein QL285_075673 [Trifolium repens]